MQDRTVPNRQYTEEFKTEAARLGESVEAHEAACRLGVPVATLGNWQLATGNWKRQRAAAGIATPEVAAHASALPVHRMHVWQTQILSPHCYTVREKASHFIEMLAFAVVLMWLR